MKKILLFFLPVLFLQFTSFSSSQAATTFPFFDDVEDSATTYSNWDRDTTIWDIKITNAHSGQQVWAMGSATGQYQYLTLASAIDLSSAPNPYFAFWVKKGNGGTGALSIEVSDNGGTSWTNLYQPSFSGALYTRFQVSLNNYRQSNILVRIGCYAPYGDTYFIDDILLDNAPTPQYFIQSDPTSNGMKVRWGQSTAPDFYKYKVVLSTTANKINDFFATSYINKREEVKVFEIYSKATVDTILTDLAFTNMRYYGKIYEQDTQDLINQGSDAVDLSTLFDVTPEIAPFVETFEGTYKWAADIPWGVTTADAAEIGHSPSHAFEDSPGNNYPAYADRRLVFQVDLASVDRPILRFNHKYSFDEMRDFGSINVSSDNSTWTNLTSITENSSGVWESREFDIGILKQQNTGYVMFQTFSNANNERDGWHLDDVEIFNNSKTTSFPFFDDVEVDTFSHNSWIDGIYNIKITNAHSGQNVWALEPSGGQYNYLTLAGTLNLSSASNPYVSFWAKKGDGGTGAVSIEVSDNAGKTWSILSQGNFTGALFTRFQVSLADYKRNNIVVRIGCYSPYGSTYFIDDILIDNAPTPQSFILSNPASTGMKVQWGQSTAPDFYKYKVVLSTTANKINDFFATSYITRREEVKVFEIYSKETLDTIITDLAFTNVKYYGKIYEQDTQDLINQGSDKVELSTLFDVTPEIAPFIETFEGTYKWAADMPWAVTTADSADSGHTAPHAYEDSPGNNYPPNADRRLIFQVDLSAVQRPVLRFNHKYSFEEMRDYGSIYFSTDNSKLITVASFTGNSNNVWESREFDVGGLMQQNTGYILFQTYSTANTEKDGWHIDDVEIYNNQKRFGLPIVDSVEIDSDSKALWVNGHWNIKITNAVSGDQVWALEPVGGQYNYLTLAGIEDLTGAPKPYLSFWIKKENGGTGAFSMEISTDGGITWGILSQQSFSGNDYVNYTFSLADYRDPRVALRIGAYSPYGSTYLMDDITIADSTGYTTDIKDKVGIIPEVYELSQNYPNPFNPSTTIRYAIPAESKVSLKIYNTLGQLVRTLVNNDQAPGYHEVVFNAENLPSGVYFYTIMANSSNGKSEYVNTKKLLLLK
ncbi:MAG: T9SS type A sorting domain-containing protein [Chlorobi bacterium]|nr:T9SS type A sorting domain-containing protein [Chlorobiota bacterium]